MLWACDYPSRLGGPGATLIELQIPYHASRRRGRVDRGGLPKIRVPGRPGGMLWLTQRPRGYHPDDIRASGSSEKLVEEPVSRTPPHAEPIVPY
jgi:hypothetical protein